MSCPSEFDAFRYATEYLPDMAYLTATYSDPFTNFIRKGEYGRGVGFVKSVFQIGRSMPSDDEPDIQAITSDTAALCPVTYNDIEWGFNESTYGPERFGWKGPLVCQDQLIFAHGGEEFLSKYIPALAKHIVQEVANRMMAIYMHFVPKAASGTAFAYGDAGTGAPPRRPIIQLPQTDCQLTQEELDVTAVQLIQETAAHPNTNGWITLGPAGPEFPLLIGLEASQDILNKNATLLEQRQWADAGRGDAAMYFQRIGATRVIKNFRHIVTPFPPRFSYNGATGRYVRVPTWDTNAATKGTVADLNPDYLNIATAPYEGALVLNDWVFESEALRPVNSAAGLNWKSKSYMGVLEFITGGYRVVDPPCFDPEEKLGRHFGSYFHAPKPIYPRYGRLIISKRCSLVTDCQSCS